MLHLTEQELLTVKDILQKNIPSLTVWAFGSRVKGNHKPYSDLDLVVITDEPLTLDVYAKLVEAFSESALPWKVDVVDWALANDKFKEIIQQQFEVIQA